MPLSKRPQFRWWSAAILAFFLTLVSGEAAVTLSWQEQAIATAVINESGQNRPFLNVDQTLTEVARQRAADMARRGYFNHTNPDGDGPNRVLERAGYRLPEIYPDNGNNIESIAAGESSPGATWSSWMDSSGHRQHLLAEHSFYVSQTALGVGYHYSPGSEYGHYWVVITAPPQAGTQLAISSPAANSKTAVPDISVAGTAGGSEPIGSVQYRMENATTMGAFKTAAGVNTWEGSISDLGPGPNTIRVRCLSAAGAVLKEVTRSITYVVLRPLTVIVEGEGIVSGNYVGTTDRELGHKYTISAIPAAQWLFEGWSGSLSARNETVSFAMSEGFTLVARFVPNPFLDRTGVYNGLVQSDPRSHFTSGFLRAKLTTTGGFTGRLTLGGVAHTFNGRFNTAGEATVTIFRRGETPLSVLLRLNGTDGGYQITGSVSDGSFVAAFAADQALPAGDQTPFVAGRYTIRVAPDTQHSGKEFPQGDGYAALTLDSFGKAKIMGSLSDGTPFSQAVAISGAGALPVYAPLYGRNGSIMGVVTFRDTGTADLDGSIHWSKPARPATRYHREAFETDNPVFGSRYVVPERGSTVVQVSHAENNAQLVLGDGNLETPIIQNATLATDNRVVLTEPAPHGLSITINAVNGRFSGKFVHPALGSQSQFRGVIFQKRNAGFGYFLGVDQSGFTTFAAQ